MEMETLKTRVNRVFYQNESDEIKEELIYNHQKVTMNEAFEHLQNRFKRPKMVLKVILEDVEIKVSKQLLDRNTKIVDSNE